MVYDPEKVTLLVDGAAVTGYADDTSISAERNEDDVTPKTGIQGDTVYSLNGNRSGTIKFTLFSSSASLSRLRRAAAQRKKVPVTLRNANSDGGFLISNKDCRILKVPSWSAGKESDPAEISIYVPLLEFKE